MSVVHSVHDRRVQWIGPWEIEDKPIDLSGLRESDKGRTVIYRDHGRAEAGTLSSWTPTTVFVRFHQGDTGAACSPCDLHFAVRNMSADFYHPPQEPSK